MLIAINYKVDKTFKRINELIEKKEVKISSHGYDELAEDGILIKDVLVHVKDSVVLEDYPDYPKGPCVLLLQFDQKGNPIHTVRGIPDKTDSPAVLVTAYRPNPKYWPTAGRLVV